jgi:hypothetical protein
MNKGLPDFTYLFRPIQKYLAKAPNCTPKELAEAKEAYNTIIAIIYGPTKLTSPCSSGPIKFVQ